ncbi:glycosyl transferase, group 1 [gamma proteobacterium NOR5-3]|nr:glycosyl transferase, group 1 [gamma proteobacterium NOR5-3]
MSKPDVIFVLSVDTEEEWPWDSAFPSTDCAVSNTRKLPAFQELCQRIGIRPTYFVDYAVAQDDEGSAILKNIAQGGTAEVGAHLHPWCNPPFYGKTGEAESHIVNLPKEQVASKLDALHELLQDRLGVRPRSFRSGRWGINSETLQLLIDRGYTVDSSVYPFYENDYFSCEGSPLTPYYPDLDKVLTAGDQRKLMELPVSAGFNRGNFDRAQRIHKALSSAPASWLRAVGLLWHTRLLRKLYLSPELTEANDMNSLVDQCLNNGQPVIHMFLHSSSLVDHVTGLMDTDNAYDVITDRIAQTLKHLSQRAKVTFCTASEAAELLKESSPTHVTLGTKREVDIVFSEVFPPMHGGSGRWLWEVYSRLDTQRYHCVAGQAPGAGDFDKNAPLTIHRLDFAYRDWSDWSIFTMRGMRFYLGLLRQFMRITRDYDVAAVHCGRCIPEGVIALILYKLKKTPYYCYIHGEDIENSATSRSLSWMLRPVLANAALLICNSENSRRLLLKHWKVLPERATVVNPGTDTSLFKPAPRSEQQRERLGWGEQFVILTVSRLEERKGHDRMIQAMPAILAEHPNTLYAIVGSGPQEQMLTELAADLGVSDNVLFMPNLSDAEMIVCYQQADLFILPNRDIGRNIEGFGIVMLEAQAAGLPVIGGLSGGTPETLINDITGFSVDCSDPSLIAEKVTRLISDNTLRDTMRTAAIAHARGYDWHVKSTDIAGALSQMSTPT